MAFVPAGPLPTSKCDGSVTHVWCGVPARFYGENKITNSPGPINDRRCQDEGNGEACTHPSDCGCRPQDTNGQGGCAETVQINLHCRGLSLLPRLSFFAWMGLAVGMLMVGSVMGFLVSRMATKNQSSRRNVNPLIPNDASIQTADNINTNYESPE